MKTENTRVLKIYYSHHASSNKRIPMILLRGCYLANMNFKIGDMIEVRVEKNEISIRKVLPSEAERGSAEAQPNRNNLV